VLGGLPDAVRESGKLPSTILRLSARGGQRLIPVCELFSKGWNPEARGVPSLGKNSGAVSNLWKGL
jgi:hypothetical protein